MAMEDDAMRYANMQHNQQKEENLGEAQGAALEPMEHWLHKGAR